MRRNQSDLQQMVGFSARSHSDDRADLLRQLCGFSCPTHLGCRGTTGSIPTLLHSAFGIFFRIGDNDLEEAPSGIRRRRSHEPGIDCNILPDQGWKRRGDRLVEPRAKRHPDGLLRDDGTAVLLHPRPLRGGNPKTLEWIHSTITEVRKG
jgi:hypothetical protein